MAVGTLVPLTGVLASRGPFNEGGPRGMSDERTSAVAPVSAIRSHFPALERRHNGFPVAYFDGPGGTQVPRAVGDAMVDYLYNHNATAHWAFPTSIETDAARDNARRTFATFLNSAPSEVVFGPNMTTLTFHLARALGYRMSAGDQIIVTELDHHANVAPWKTLETECGVTVRQARMQPDTGQLDWEHLESLACNRTRLIAIGAASNALGTVNDVFRAAQIARSVGALLFVDGVHYAPHNLVDVQALGCDFFACSAYKCYGPHVGVLFGRRHLLDELEFPKLIPAPDTAPERAETGTLNHEGVVGAAAALEWLGSLAPGTELRARLRSVFVELQARSAELFEGLWQGLAATQGVTLYGPGPAKCRTPTAAFTVAGVASSEVSRLLAGEGVFTSHGDFYAYSLVERLGLQPEGLVRAGFACYTTSEETARLVNGVRRILRR